MGFDRSRAVPFRGIRRAVAASKSPLLRIEVLGLVCIQFDAGSLELAWNVTTPVSATPAPDANRKICGWVGKSWTFFDSYIV
jgi:hypothetical protein